jgi:hypothetical protein
MGLGFLLLCLAQYNEMYRGNDRGKPGMSLKEELGEEDEVKAIGNEN